jgi:hypothetical protein
MGEMRSTLILVSKSEWMKPLGRPGRRWNLKEVG